MKLKIKKNELDALVYTLRSRTMTLQESGQNEDAYWALRDIMANLPCHVYKWPKKLDDAYLTAKRACLAYEYRLPIKPNPAVFL